MFQINQKVIYHLKACLIQMEIQGVMSPDIPEHLFSISTVGQKLIAYAIGRWRAGWNYHYIPRKSTPISYVAARQNDTVSQLHSVEEAERLFYLAGRQLSQAGVAGVDLLAGRPDLAALRDTQWRREFTELEVWAEVINGRYANAWPSFTRHFEITRNILDG